MAMIKRGAIVEHALLSTAETYIKVKVTVPFRVMRLLCTSQKAILNWFPLAVLILELRNMREAMK
ncbi:hypothetical protein FHW20_004234 [Ochrobactrum intermedium]|uniref:Uncharacterized protein n=1 Tax=Brucella intermedia TaxID=94625 RepID=A0ABR6AUV9_9HYPH|nr:hypothetical protein [Brucella intermedia]